MSAADVIPAVSNVVVKAHLGTRLDLRKVALGVPNAEYDPRKYPAVVVRSRKYKATLLVFASGAVMCTGTTDVEAAAKALEGLAAIVRRRADAPSAGLHKMEVVNMVGAADFGFELRLQTLAEKHPLPISYDQERTPFLNYRIPDMHVSARLTMGGNVAIVGARSRREIEIALLRMRAFLREFRRGGYAPAAAAAGGDDGPANDELQLVDFDNLEPDDDDNDVVDWIGGLELDLDGDADTEEPGSDDTDVEPELQQYLPPPSPTQRG